MAARDAGQGNCFSCRAAVSGMRWGGLTFELGEGEDEGDATACSRMAPEKPLSRMDMHTGESQGGPHTPRTPSQGSTSKRSL